MGNFIRAQRVDHLRTIVRYICHIFGSFKRKIDKLSAQCLYFLSWMTYILYRLSIRVHVGLCIMPLKLCQNTVSYYILSKQILLTKESQEYGMFLLKLTLNISNILNIWNGKSFLSILFHILLVNGFHFLNKSYYELVKILSETPNRCSTSTYLTVILKQFWMIWGQTCLNSYQPRQKKFIKPCHFNRI